MITTRNVLFFHFPKTGGTWISKILMDHMHGDKWFPTPVGSNKYSLCAEHTPPDMVPSWFSGRRLKFAVVRNPITWYQSTFCYKQLFNGWDGYDIEKHCRTGDFNTFVNNVLDRYPQGYLSQMYKIFFWEDLSHIDYIGRFETLRGSLVAALQASNELTPEIRDIIETDAPSNQAYAIVDKYPRVNADYDEKTLDRVRKVESWAMEKFNYD